MWSFIAKLILPKRRSAAEEEMARIGMQRLAKRIAEAGKYYLDDLNVFVSGMMNVVAVGIDDRQLKIYVKLVNNHPDCKRLSEADPKSHLQFEYRNEPILGIDPSELCAYLRVKVG